MIKFLCKSGINGNGMTKFLFNIESEVLKKIRKEVAPYGGTVSGFIRKLIHDYFKNK